MISHVLISRAFGEWKHGAADGTEWVEQAVLTVGGWAAFAARPGLGGLGGGALRVPQGAVGLVERPHLFLRRQCA